MKSKITLLFFLSALMISCSKEANVDQEAIKDGNDMDTRRDEPGGGEPIVLYDDLLLAGQHIESGTISAVLVEGVIEVTYNTNSDWEIEETHLFVGDLSDLPTNGGGNPKIGRFPYKGNHASGTSTVTYSTIELQQGECVYVAAHAVVTNVNTGQTETAWGNGVPIGGNSWAMMFEVCY
ncbi:hypothetical protein KXJ69_07755 [Aureisphaera sp. CAU 1614]|uniref:Uncharacterized protein n=1 Tax=Halomarinibacterium sedimenti TaxID=2857106 RepID=A0A9X1K035_9FLAO|nr:hypothetical protein [Halomarinibacterium sedimenti]MBW2937996.1 hypothetical protein [Halomarinibacterium sedimenti]